MFSIRFAPALCLGVLALVAAPARADNWPRFRGPNGDGVAHDKNIPVEFSEKSGMLWKTALPGDGNSSPVIWDKHLFLQCAVAKTGARALVCLDAVSGKPRWRRGIEGTRAKRIHGKNSPASSTPATDGEVVVTAFWDSKDVHLVAFDFDGNALWRKKLGPWTSQHGAGASPIIYKDKVIFANDMDLLDENDNEVAKPSMLYCFQKKSGELLWSRPRQAYRACYSAPLIRERAGAAPELIVTSTTAITGYNLDNGQPYWEWKWSFTSKMPLRTTASSILHHGMLFSCSGDGGGDRHTVALKLAGKGNAKPAVAWQNKKEFPYVPTILAHGDYLYFAHDKGFVGCFHAASGKQVWYKRLAQTSFTSSPVLIDSKIYACSEQGDVYVIAAEPVYRLLGTSHLGETLRATPAVANGRLYIRGDRHLFCIGKE